MATENEVNKLCLAWTTDIEAELIEEIRKKEYLWDHRHPLYAKKSLKACRYLEIKEILTQRYPFQRSLFSTPNLIDKKFNNLKEYYKKEVKRLKSFISGDSGLDFQPKWKHFKRLEFLSDVIAADAITSNLDPVADGGESVTDADKTTEEDNDSFLEIDVSVYQPKEVTKEELENDQQKNRDSDTSNSLSTSGALSITKKRKLENSYKGKNNTAGSDIISEANEIMEKINVKEDGEDGFGRFIADYMRRLPYHIREKARINMLTALYSTVYEESE